MRKRDKGLKVERDITVAEAMEMEAAAWEAVVQAYKATAKAYEADGDSESAASARRRAADADKGVSEAWERSLDALGGAWNLAVAEKTGVDALEGAALARKMIPPLQEDAENSEDARKPFEDAVVAWQKAAQAWDTLAETYGGEKALEERETAQTALSDAGKRSSNWTKFKGKKPPIGCLIPVLVVALLIAFLLFLLLGPMWLSGGVIILLLWAIFKTIEATIK